MVHGAAALLRCWLFGRRGEEIVQQPRRHRRQLRRSRVGDGPLSRATRKRTAVGELPCALQAVRPSMGDPTPHSRLHLGPSIRELSGGLLIGNSVGDSTVDVRRRYQNQNLEEASVELRLPPGIDIDALESRALAH